ncbi:MAG: tetratricopeptide repeat protein [Deltaproteobacteria bacterium]|nr:tetratricopeptide repeat protein [Deltaproteobacteria bacterium]
MIKTVFVLIYSFLILLYSAPIDAQPHLTELVKKVQPAVVKIVVYDLNRSVSKIGSGFFINERGHLITNYHVLNGAFSAEVIAHDGGKYPIDLVIAQNRYADLVKVTVNIPRLLVRWLVVTDQLPAIAEQVLVVGNPLGLNQTVSEGIVSAIREVPQIGKFFQTTAPISPGYSGSPVVNMRGKAVGVISFQSVFGQNLNFAVSGRKVIELVDETVGKTLAEWTYRMSNQKTKLAEELCRKGFRFSVKGEYKKALAFYKEAIDKNPEDISAWYGLGQCYVGLDRPKQAIDTYKKAIRIHTKDASLLYFLGNYYNTLGMHNEAAGAYKKAAQISPESAAIYDRLGRTYSILGLYKKAIEAHYRVLQINPHSAASHFQIGVAHGKLENIKEAIDAYRRAVGIDPDFAPAFSAMGILMGKLGNYQKQLEAFKQAIRINPDDPTAHYFIGISYAELEDRKSALQEYKILKELDPLRAKILFGRIYP